MRSRRPAPILFKRYGAQLTFQSSLLLSLSRLVAEAGQEEQLDIICVFSNVDIIELFCHLRYKKPWFFFNRNTN